MGKMLEQLDRRPAGRQPTAAQLTAGQRFQLAHQPGAKAVEVPEEDLRATAPQWRAQGMASS
jgi:hypothetical protein